MGFLVPVTWLPLAGTGVVLLRQIADMPRKLVGVGSVGTRGLIVPVHERDHDDPVFLQVKEATTPVLEDHVPRSRYSQPGARVVKGRRLTPAASDISLGWTARTIGSRGATCAWTRQTSP